MIIASLTTTKFWILAGGGLGSGVLAGLLGIGGGVVLVPLLVTLGYTPVQAVATSSLSILITAISGTIQNRRMGYISAKRVMPLGIPAIFTAQIGAYLADKIFPYILLMAFGILLLINIYLVELRRQITSTGEGNPRPIRINPTVSRIGTGGTAGMLAGFFGVGGGVIMVPLQMLLLEETIKVAIQTSLGVIVITAVSACIGHYLRGNVLFVEGVIMGMGGLLGAQIGTRYLPKLPDRVVSLVFRSMLGILAVYMFWQAWRNYQGL